MNRPFYKTPQKKENPRSVTVSCKIRNRNGEEINSQQTVIVTDASLSNVRKEVQNGVKATGELMSLQVSNISAYYG